MLTKLKDKIKLALRVKSNSRAAHAAAVQDYKEALAELHGLKVRWWCGQISQRTYQVYKAGTTELRKDLERAALVCKQEIQWAHDRHDRLLNEYAEELKKAKTQYAEDLVKARDSKGRAAELLSSMSAEDIDALRYHFLQWSTAG